MNVMAVLGIVKSVGLMLIGIGLIIYAAGAIIERRNNRREA